LLGIEAQDRRGDAHEDVAALGGPLRLSGYGVDTLRGDGAALASVRYSYPWAQVLDYPVFFGGSLEAGQVWRDGQDPAWERFIAGGSIYSALDTPIGPIYFGLGLAEGGEETVFFRLGQPY
jgi:NTE family protein